MMAMFFKPGASSAYANRATPPVIMSEGRDNIRPQRRVRQGFRGEQFRVGSFFTFAFSTTPQCPCP